MLPLSVPDVLLPCHQAKLHETEVSGVETTLSELAFVVNQASAGLLLSLLIVMLTSLMSYAVSTDIAYG